MLLEDSDNGPIKPTAGKTLADFEAASDTSDTNLENSLKKSQATAAMPDDHPMKPYKVIDEVREFLDETGMEAEISSEIRDLEDEEGMMRLPAQENRRKKLKETFLNMGDPEPFEDDDFEMENDLVEDMNSLAHGELEHHREMRHYARLAAWEMPLLSSMLWVALPRRMLLMRIQNLRSHLSHRHSSNP